MKIGVEEAIDHGLAQESAHQDRRQRLQIVPRFDQRPAVGELDAVDPFERHHSAGGPAPVDLRHEEAALGHQILAQLGGRGRFLAQVELAVGPLPEGGDDEARAKPRRLASHRFDLSCRPFIGFDGGGEILLDPGPQNLDRDQPAFGGDGAVDLGNRSGTDRVGIDLRKDLFNRLAEALFDRGLDRLERGRRAGCPAARQGRAPPPRRPDPGASPAPDRI